MKKYLARWDWRMAIEEVEIIKETESSVWVLQCGDEQRRAKITETSMYCPTHKFAVEKIRQESQLVIDRERNSIEQKEKILNIFLEKYTKPEI